MNKLAQQIQATGLRVFVRNGSDTYAYFTDGKSIGYIQEEHGAYCCSTVHIPNRTTGTGYKLDPISQITRENLEKAFVFAPQWANGSARQSIAKFRTLEAFLKENSWGSGLVEIPQEVSA